MQMLAETSGSCNGMKFDKDKFIQTFVVMRYIISCIYFQSIHWQVQNNTDQTKRSHERDKALWPQAQCDRRVRRLPKRAVRTSGGADGSAVSRQ